MELTPEQLRDVHDMASHTIAESELPRVVRERDALLEVARLTMKAHEEMFEQCLSNGITNAWGKSVTVLHLNLANEAARKAIALCEQPKPEPQPCPTPPTDPTA